MILSHLVSKAICSGLGRGWEGVPVDPASLNPRRDRLADPHGHRSPVERVPLAIEEVVLGQASPAQLLQVVSHPHDPGPLAEVRGPEAVLRTMRSPTAPCALHVCSTPCIPNADVLHTMRSETANWLKATCRLMSAPL